MTGIVCCTVALAGTVHAAEARRSYDLPAGDAASTLGHFAGACGRQLFYMVDKVRGERTNAVKGTYSARDALERMLAGTALVFHEDTPSGGFIIGRAALPGAARQPGEGRPPPPPLAPAKSGRSRAVSLLVSWLALFTGSGQPAAGADAAADDAPRTLSGRVVNAATGAYLEGARITIRNTGHAALTDAQGRFTIGAPAGDAVLVATYSGLEPSAVPIHAGLAALPDIALTSAIYRLQPFVVEGERESSAFAIARQRQAPNVKNVVATDAFGTMTEDNVGAFLQKIPGIVATDVSGSGVREVMVRGIDAALNTVEMDGVQLANNNSTGTNRAFDFFQSSLSLIESIEVTKAPTPDRPASSIGGAINLVTRSAFNRNAPRQIRYSFGLATLLGREGGRAESRVDEPIAGLTPALTLAYSDVFGRDRKLGLTLSYSRNSVFFSSTNTEHYYQSTLDRPAYIYRTRLNLAGMAGPSVRQSTGLKLEYKLSERSTFAFNAAHNFYIERPYSLELNLQTANNASQIRPGYTERFSEILPSAASTTSMSATAWDNFTHNFRFLASGTHRFDRLTIDYTGTASLSRAFQNLSPDERQYDHGVKTKGRFSLSGPRNLGWTIDRSADDSFATVAQTTGADIYDLANYAGLTLRQDNRIARSALFEGRINVRKNFKLVVPGYIKAGGQIQRQERRKDYHYHSYRFTGPDGLGQFRDDAAWTRRALEGQRQGAWLDIYRTARHKEEHPEQWPEDLFYKYSQRLRNLHDFGETISALYAMSGLRLGALGVLGGLRFERTATEGNGPIGRLAPEERARRAAWTGPLTAEEAERRAVAEWGTGVHAEGNYQNTFPSLHFTYAPKSGLVARLSYSTSIGRPPITSILPNMSVDEEALVVSVANTGLRPQRSDNFDLNLEYYFEPIGLLSASVFLKEVENFIYSSNTAIIANSPDNGFDGLYGGYRLSTSYNGGRARYRGFELSYQQQFTFLPGFWRGFGINANYTRLDTQGNYGRAVTTNRVAGFRPMIANAALTYQKGKYRGSLQGNWVGSYLVSIAANPAQTVHERARITLALKLTYDLSRRTSVYLNLDNLTRSPINHRYYTYEDRVGFTRLPYRSLAIGVQGRF